MKNGKIFLNEKNVSKIEILRRTKKNYTHFVNIDSTIFSVTTWRKSKFKFRLNLITNFLSLGILHLIALLNPKIYLKIYCKESLPSNSDFFLVEDIFQNFTLCKTIYRKSSKKQSSYISNQQNIDKIVNVNIFFVYNSMKYKYDNNLNTIIPVYFDLSKYKNNYIKNTFCEGINTKERYKIQIEKYGQNIMDLKNKLLYENFIQNDLPQCISVFVSGGICFYCGVSIFGALLMFLSVVVILMKLIYIYVKFIKVLGHDLSLDGIIEYKVKRNYMKEKIINGYSMVKNIDLVPGDIIYLSEGETLPCDGLLLDGECILNESKIVGTVDTDIKYALESNNNLFNYENSKNSILLHGSEILKIYSKNANKTIIVLIINTGVNTFKANLINNLLNKTIINKPSNHLYVQIFKNHYLLFMILLYIASSTGIIIRYIMEGKKYPVIEHLILNLGLVLMPIYYIIICSIKQLGIFNLNRDKNNGIKCIDESRLIESGTINRVIFDKTGTLTTNDYEISAFIPLYYDFTSLKHYFKIYEKKNIKKICDEHLIYYRNYLLNNTLDNYQLNIQQQLKNYLIESVHDKNTTSNTINNNYELSALFLQCLICCTNTAKINNEICGNILEKEIIDIMKWDINTVEIISENNSNSDFTKKSENIIDKIHKFGGIFFNDAFTINNNYNYNSLNVINEVFPKNYYKVTEGMKIFKNRSRSKTIRKTNEIFKNSINKLSSFKLIIITRFLGQSYMNISCIVYNFLEDNYRFMIKGPPEKILRHCTNNTIPDIEKLLTKCLKEGNRIIACATKIIQYSEKDKNKKEEYYLKELTFCGFILFKNNLKEESRQIINNLRKMECETIISTGDSLINAVGTGLKCELFTRRNIFALDLYAKGKKPKILVSMVSDKNEQENDMKSDQESDNNYSIKKTLSQLKLNNVNNSLINDGPSSSRQMIMDKNEILSNNINETNKKDENESSTLENIDFGSENNSPFSNYFNEEGSILTNNKKSSKASLINGIEQSQKSLKNIISNGKKESQRSNTSKKKNLSRKIVSPDNFHLESYKHFHNNLSPVINRKKNINNINYLKSSKNIIINNLINSPGKINKNKAKDLQKTNSKISSANKNDLFNNNRNTYINQKFFFDCSLNKLSFFKDDCSLCFSGLALRYIYEKRNKNEIKLLLKLMNKYGKIFYAMSSSDKTLLIKINKELFNKKICTVGDGYNDTEAILSSNVGIFIGKRNNINTLLSHYFIEDNNLMNIETIIKNGRGYYENDNILLPVNFTFTSCYVGLITYSYYLERKVDNIMLTILNLSIFILCVTAFSIKPEYKINYNHLASNEKLLKLFKLIRFLGIFIIKIICQIIFYFIEQYNENIDMDTNKDIFLTYIFIMTWSQSMSSVLVFNINTFYRKSFLSNLIFLMLYFAIFLYIIYLLTLNDISLGKVELINVSFEFERKNVDYFDDTHKLILLIIILGDIIIPSILVIVLQYFFEKKALYYKQKKMEK